MKEVTEGNLIITDGSFDAIKTLAEFLYTDEAEPSPDNVSELL